jgi:hypothetical protein
MTCRPESLQECWTACILMQRGVFLWIYSVFVVFSLYLIKEFYFLTWAHVANKKKFDLET